MSKPWYLRISMNLISVDSDYFRMSFLASSASSRLQSPPRRATCCHAGTYRNMR